MALNDRRIEIFAPFGEAFELMQKILFQPFNLGKWFVIGFAAWLATFFSGGGGFNRWWNKGDWRWQAHHQGATWSLHDSPPWVIPVFLFGFLVVLALAFVFIWLNSHGRFVFVDCIVRNRGAIGEPWREYATEANRFFVFQLVLALCSLFLVGGFALLFFVSSHAGAAIIAFPLLIFFAVAFVLLALVVALVAHLMVPVMYRQRCGAMEAFRAVWSLVVANLGVFILFVLFLILLYVAAAFIGCLAGCVTCCIAALPYIGTVILLPIVLTLYAFPLCFLRQFGDQYDVFAVVRLAEQLSPPASPPPMPPSVPPVQDGPPPPFIPPVQDGPPPS